MYLPLLRLPLLLRQLSLSHTQQKPQGNSSDELPFGVSAHTPLTAMTCGLLAGEQFKPVCGVPRDGNLHSLTRNGTHVLRDLFSLNPSLWVFSSQN